MGPSLSILNEAKVKYVVLSMGGFLCVEAGHREIPVPTNIKQIIIKLEPQFQCRRNREIVHESGLSSEESLPFLLPYKLWFCYYFLNYLCIYLAASGVSYST